MATNDEKINAFLNGFKDAYKRTSDYKDSAMMEIYLRRQEFEKNLDDMWSRCFPGNYRQMAVYKEQVQHIKSVGLVVMRSKSTGKHKIVLPK